MPPCAFLKPGSVSTHRRLHGFHLLQAGHITEPSRKCRGGRICFYINGSYTQNLKGKNLNRMVTKLTLSHHYGSQTTPPSSSCQNTDEGCFRKLWWERSGGRRPYQRLSYGRSEWHWVEYVLFQFRHQGLCRRFIARLVMISSLWWLYTEPEPMGRWIHLHWVYHSTHHIMHFGQAEIFIHSSSSCFFTLETPFGY